MVGFASDSIEIDFFVGLVGLVGVGIYVVGDFIKCFFEVHHDYIHLFRIIHVFGQFMDGS